MADTDWIKFLDFSIYILFLPLDKFVWLSFFSCQVSFMSIYLRIFVTVNIFCDSCKIYEVSHSVWLVLRKYDGNARKW